jgi:general transcription factor 3C polypeptide 5 (transcription factor C subunit 1)
LGLKDFTKTIGVSLRPDDALAKPVMSNTVKTNNLLLKVTVPKRTGRKRKRGSDGPFLSGSEVQQNGASVERVPLNPNVPFVEANTVLSLLVSFRKLIDSAVRIVNFVFVL